MAEPRVRMVCCPGAEAPEPFACPRRAEAPARDHVLRRELAAPPEGLVASDDDNPFVRYRHLLYAANHARDQGVPDERVVEVIRDLDARVAAVDGRGFRVTPLTEEPRLAEALGLGGSLWVKDETGNVSGSHKGRHLFEVMSYLELAVDRGRRRAMAPLAIASCGNAAVAAAVIARAAEWDLDVFIPPWAHEGIQARLLDLDAELVVCPRRAGEVGDPSALRFRERVAGGAIPFSCQGPDDGLAVVGGLTLGYELVEQLEVPLDRLFVQVGGGALASACTQALREAHRWGLVAGLPRFHAVQAAGGHPLVRAYDRLVAEALSLPAIDALDLHERARRAEAIDREQTASIMGRARAERARFMWPWEQEPRSLATGILDDETYDWAAVVEGMLVSGGFPIVVDEAAIADAHRAGHAHTAMTPSATGTAGLAGALTLAGAELLPEGQHLGVLFTGRQER